MRPSLRHRVSPSPARLRARAGFTLPELIVSILVITVGVLAMASTSVGVLRQMRAGNQVSLASYVAQSRMESLRGLQCSSITSGAGVSRGMIEAWTVTALSTKITAVAETVTYQPRPGVTRQLGTNAVIPCR